MLLNDVQKMKDRLESLIQQYMSGDCAQGLSACQLNSPSPDDIVAALRAGEPPAAMHQLLSQFALKNRHNPVIRTDRGKVLYVDFNPSLIRVSLYIGREEECIKVFDSPSKSLYIMVVDERYDYYPVAGGAVVRDRLGREDLLETDGDRRPGVYTAALHFHVFQTDPYQLAECLLRTEWIPAVAAPEGAGGVARQRAQAQAVVEPVAATVEDKVGPEGGAAESGPVVRRAMVQTATSRLKPVYDPRTGNSNCADAIVLSRELMSA